MYQKEEGDYVVVSDTATSLKLGSESKAESERKSTPSTEPKQTASTLEKSETMKKNLESWAEQSQIVINDVAFSARAVPPQDFFCAYSKHEIVLPLLLLYLTVMFALNVANSLLN